MPVISVNRDLLFKELGKTYTEEEFDELCFEFGIELDDVKEEDGEIVYKIDLPANRYDLLCLEGLVTALLVFQNKQPTPIFKVNVPTPEVAAKTKMTVSPETLQIRPFVVCAVLRGITLNEDRYKSFLDLQDHLHRNICRRRTLVAIGTHDLDSLQGPFTYEALPPKDIKFRHLFAEKEMEGKEMLDWFRTQEEGKHIREYTNIIYDSPVYPVIYDANRTVLSLPPIINGYHSKISTETKNVYIECTATDRTKAEIVLNTVVAMFSKYCDEPFSVEKVDVEYSKEPHKNYGLKRTFPNMEPRTTTCSIDELCSIIGVEIPPAQACDLLSKMMLGPAVYDQANRSIMVTVPVTRSDILHEVDIIEDAAIAYGYNNVPRTAPVSHTPGKELSINLLTDLVRNEIGLAGYTECLNWGLQSTAENFTHLRKPVDDSFVSIANPKTMAFQVARTTLIAGLLKTMNENSAMPIANGIKLFEVSDVVLRDASVDVGARNERRIAALYTGRTAGFEIIHGLVDRIMQILNVTPSEEYCKEAANSQIIKNMVATNQAIGSFKVIAAENDTYLPTRGAKVLVKLNGKDEFEEVGTLGILHPEVIKNFDHKYPTSVLEMNLQYFL